MSESAKPREKLWPYWAILISCAAVLAYQYFAQVEYRFAEQSLSRHQEIISAEAASPYRYRVLVPYLAEPAIRLAEQWTTRQKAYLAVYLLYDAVAIGFTLLATFSYLRQFFRGPPALIGTLYMAVMMVLTLRDHYFMPWSWIEPGLVALALLFLHRGRLAWMVPLTVVASLNRETSVLLPVLLAVTLVGSRLGEQRESPVRGRPWIWVMAVISVWVVIFLGLRAALGVADPYSQPQDLWQGNTEPLRLLRAVVNVALFGGVFWLFAIWGFRQAPQFVRRSTLVIPPYLIGVLIFGVWYEVRLLLPLYPIVLPLALFQLSRILGYPAKAPCGVTPG